MPFDDFAKSEKLLIPGINSKEEWHFDMVKPRLFHWCIYLEEYYGRFLARFEEWN